MPEGSPILTEFAPWAVQWTWLGAWMAFLFALLELVRRTPVQMSLVVMAVLIGQVQLRYAWFMEGRLHEPVRFLWLYAGVMAAGPSLLYLFRSRFQTDGQRLLAGMLPHFLPAAAMAVFELVFFLSFLLGGRMNELTGMIQAGLAGRQFDFLHVVTAVASLHISVYSLWLLAAYHSLSKTHEIYEIRLIWATLLLPVAANCLIGPGFFLGSPWMFELGCLAITGVVGCLFVIQARYPGFFSEMVNEIRTHKYQNTPLSDRDIQLADGKLKEIMQQRELYCDPDLRLVDLAAALGLSVHQTSRLLNEVYGQSYHEFINGYRVEAACSKLLEQPDKNILTIAYQVGFNSKSTFNAQFVKLKGSTPGEYRRKHKGSI
jgi:AraC-like DNA-binding protein